MVVVISLLTASMAIPLFVNSSRANKLRTSARTVVAAHRYARGMAVLRQADMVLLLDESAQRIQVVRLKNDPSSTVDTNDVASTPASMESRFFLGAEERSTDIPTNAVMPELDRTLPDGARIARVEVTPMQRHEYTTWINYHPNGMCDPFEIDLADDRDGSLSIRVDGSTGRAKVVE